MDALLKTTFPFLSLLALPLLTSSTTSLNLLFFYLTWSTLLLSNSPLKVEAIGTLAVRLLFYLLPSYFFLAFDLFAPSLAAATKEHAEVGLLAGEEGVVQGGFGSKRGVRRKIARVVGVSTVNVLLGVGVQAVIEAALIWGLHLRSALRITTTLPFPYAVAKDLVKVFALREVLSYALHRYVLHHDSSPLSKSHRKYYHALSATYPCAAHYDHPAAYLIRVFLPTYIPAVVFRLHLLTYLLFLALVSLEELFAYSGYSVLPSGFILGGVARRHERHLMGGAEGNYSAYGLADLLMGTSLGSDVLDDVRDESERRDVPRRISGRVKDAGRKAKKGARRGERAVREREEE